LKSKLIFSLIFILPVSGFSQGEWDNWYFGVHAGMNFSSGIPIAITTSAMGITGGAASASVSDSAGNLLFYSNGYFLYNANNVLMPDGTGLKGGAAGAVQPVFAVQTLFNTDQYYLFTVGNQTLTPTQPVVGLFYTVIDMRLNSGLGGIVPGMKNIAVPDGDSAMSQLMATRHHNNKDVWLLVLHHGTGKKYYAYLITAAGISDSPVISNSQLPPIVRYSPGVLKVSPDGSTLVCTDSLTEVCDFNNVTGVVTPRFLFHPNPDPLLYAHGMDFSLDSKLLYIVTMRSGAFPESNLLIQYDVTLPDSVQFVGSGTYLGNAAGHIQMGPDWKLYVSYYIGNIDTVSRINNPSVNGVGCNFQKIAVGLSGNDNNCTLPQFLQRYKAYIHCNGHCYPDTTFCYGDIWPPADSIHWDFGNPASGSNNYSNEPTPAHKFTQPGQYTIALFVRHNDTRTDTSWRTITIYDTPIPVLGEDITICQGDSATFDAGSFPGCTYSWDNLTTGQIAIDTGQTFSTGAEGIYSVTVTSPQDCIGRDTVQLTVVAEALVYVTPPTLSVCSEDTTNLELSSNVTNANFSWSAFASSPLVTGYNAGTGDTIEQVLVNTDTITQMVTYTITPQNANCTFIPLDYPVTVYPLPDVYFVPGGLSVCSGQLAVINIFSHVSGASFSWTATGSSGYVSGFANGSGSIIDQLLINSGADTEYVTYHILPTSADGCVGQEIDYVVTVLPTVVVAIIPPTTVICSGETTGIDLQCSLSGCSFNWTAVASSPDVTGYSGGSGNSIQQTIINSSISPQTVTYSITPNVTGCGSQTSDYIITVNPLLPVSISVSASANPVCEGIPVTFTGAAMNGGSTPSYQWQVNAINAGINNAVFTYTPENGDIVSCVLTSSEPCTSGNPASSNPVIMTVVEAPEVTFIPCFDTITTTNTKPILLRGGIPMGGVFSGTGVESVVSVESGIKYYFDPALAGAGIHEITYNYINSAGCRDSSRLSIINYQLSIHQCGTPLLDIRDSTLYPTVQIGPQCWFAANLDYGTELAYFTPQRDNCTPEKYCNTILPVPCALSSVLYQWDELMCYQETEALQGLCPSDWHVPSEADWNTLFANWTNSAFAGEPLKYTGYSGFNAFLKGAGFFNKGWWFGDFATIFWSSTSHGPYKAWAHGMHEVNYSVSYYPSYRSNAFSVRCLRD